MVFKVKIMKIINKKRLLTAALTGLLSCTMLVTAACQPRNAGSASTSEKEKKPTVEQTVDQKLNAYTTDLMDSTEAAKSNGGLRTYLTSWAKTKGIECRTDQAGNVIMKRKASSSYQQAPPTVIVCPYDSATFADTAAPMAMSLFLIKNTEGTGDLTVVFTPRYQGTFDKLAKLDKSVFEDEARVFCLNDGPKGMFSLSTGSGATYRFIESIHYRSAEYPLAYKISVRGLPGGSVSESADDDLNPIIMFREFLAGLKSSGIGFELASIRSGSSRGVYPTSGTMTVTVDKDKEVKFLERLNSKVESFNEDKEKKHPGAEISFTKVPVPSRVIRQEDSNRFISFLYTLLSGNYYTDEETGDRIAANGICMVRVTGSRIQVDASLCSLEKSHLRDLLKTEKTLASLSDVSFRQLSAIPGWTAPEDQTFTEDVEKAYKKYTGNSLKFSDSIATSPAGRISRISPKTEIIGITVNQDVLKECAGTIVKYMIASKPDEDQM